MSQKLTALALALLVGCGSAPSYSLVASIGEVHIPCTVSPAFDFECPTFADWIETDTVQLDGLELRVTGHGCRGGGFECDTFEAAVTFEMDGSFHGGGSTGWSGIVFGLEGSLS